MAQLIQISLTRFYIPLLAITLVVSALLMFVLEPVSAKMILPLLGGSSYVWNTCVVFFQSVLLSAYVYVFLLNEFSFKLKVKLFIQVIIVWLPIFTLPLRPPIEEPWLNHPYLWLMYSLVSLLGPIFFAISTTAPMVQNWLSSSSLPQARDPYFLYAISNFGGLIFLISYPFAIEPNCSLSYQLNAISFAYAAFAALTTICAWLTYKCAAPELVSDENYEQIEKELLKQEPKNSQYALWLLLTALPSSLMLGLTNYVTSDLASLPLFFVVPLAIYMLTFTLAFAIDFSRVLKAMVIMSAISAIGIFIFLFNETRITNGETVMTGFITSGISLHLICLFITSLTCHAKVAVSRPAPAFLTSYYLAIALGGILGSSFNSFIAPLIFTDFFEYQIALATAAAVLVCTINLEKRGRLLPASSAIVMLASGLALLACNLSKDTKEIVSKRNFFGVLKIKTDKKNTSSQIWNGVTLHGGELLDKEKRNKPIFYYGESSPSHDVFSILEESKKNFAYAMLGMGAGSLVSYAKSGQEVLIYELNPNVIDFASNPFYFSYTTEAKKRGAKIDIQCGDARVNIRKAPDKFLQLIVLDTFSSDSIPLHLITKEALSLYQTKLTNDGSILFHVTNNYYDLKKPIARVAQSLGYEAISRNSYFSQRLAWQEPTDWILISKNKKLLEQLKDQYHWNDVVPDPKMRLWTDDYCDPLSVLNIPFS